MKTLIVIALMLPMCIAAQTNQNDQTGRVAIPTESRDTLFVLTNLAPLFSEIWKTCDDVKKPTIIAVNTLIPYLRNKYDYEMRITN